MKQFIYGIALFVCGAMHSQINLTNNLVLCMPMDGNATDYSGKGNHGAFFGNIVFVADRNGVPNAACEFDGQNSYIKIPGSSSFDSIENNSQLTVAAWCNVYDWYQGWNVFSIFDRYNSVNDLGLDFTIQAPVNCNGPTFAANFPVTGMGANGCDFSMNSPTTFDTWSHYAITYSKTGLFAAYKNGVLLGTLPANNLSLEQTNNGDVYIGFSPSGVDEYSHGAIDELMVYNRVLTSAEIGAIYNGYQCKATGPVTSIGEKSSSGFISLYPNPADNKLNVTLASFSQNDVLVSIQSPDGKLVLNTELTHRAGGSYEVSVSGLSAGLYLVTVTNGRLTQKLKLLKR